MRLLRRLIAPVIAAVVALSVFVVPALAVASYDSTITGESPTRFYKMHSFSGSPSVFADSSGCSCDSSSLHNGTLSAVNTGITPNSLNGATGWSGTEDYWINSGTSPTTTISTSNNWTYEFWFQPTTFGITQMLLTTYNDPTSMSQQAILELYMNTSNHLVMSTTTTTGASSATSADAFSSGVHQVDWEIGGAGGTNYLLVDGTPEASDNWSATEPYSGAFCGSALPAGATYPSMCMQVGGEYANSILSYGFKGNFEDLSVFNSLLSTGTVASNYQSGLLQNYIGGQNGPYSEIIGSQYVNLQHQYGQVSFGPSVDSGDSSQLTAERITTNSDGLPNVGQICAYVNSVDSSPNNAYGLGIYSELSGAPDNLLAGTVASAGADGLVANSWNCLSISPHYDLAPSTDYWLVFGTNGSTSALNNLSYTASAGTSATTPNTWSGTLPSFGTPTFGTNGYSIIALN